MRYQIMGERCGKTHELDETESLRKAESLLRQYYVEFGNDDGWRIWIEDTEKTDDD